MALTHSVKKTLLVIGDLAAFLAALLISILLRYGARGIDAELLILHLEPFTVLFALWILVLFVYNLYEPRHLENSAAFASLAAHAFAVNAILAVAFFYFNPLVGITPRTVLFVDMGFSMLLFGVWRFLFNKLLRQRLLQDIVLVGVNDRTVALAQMLRQHPNLGYRVKALVGDHRLPLPAELATLPRIRTLQELENHHRALHTIVLAEDPTGQAESATALLALLRYKVSVQSLPSFVGHALQKIPVSELTAAWFLQNLSEGEKRFYETAKYALDVAGALLLGLLTLPLTLLIALGIKLEDGRKVFYRQTRVGKDRRVFRILKFQTMVESAEQDGPKWTERHDPRVTRFGKFLRETRLDELPQLWNILLGEMSFIGPRPERPEFVEHLEREIPFYAVRHLVRPGLSGWAQINYPYGSSVQDAYEKLQYDIYYLKNRSLGLDLAIALKTLSIILRKKGQ